MAILLARDKEVRPSHASKPEYLSRTLVRDQSVAFSNVRDGPPSIRYDASVNGAPEKPITACFPASSRRTMPIASRTGCTSGAGLFAYSR